MASSPRPLLQRDAIISAARQLIVADGLEALSLRRLAAKLGVTAPALYAHVRDKNDVLMTLADEEFADLIAKFDAADDPDPLERIRGNARAYVEHALANPEMFKVMFLFPPDLVALSARRATTSPGATKAFTGAAGNVAEAISSGAINCDNPELASLTIWSGVHGVASVTQLGFDLPPEVIRSLTDEVVNRILAGYGA